MDNVTELIKMMEASGVKRSVREVPKMQSEEQLRREYAPSLKRELATGAEAAVRGFGKGATLGLSDHISALVMMGTRKAAGYGGADNTYENALRDVREQNKVFETQSPIAYGTGQVVGGAALLPGFAGATIPQAVGRTAVMGAVQGGAGAETVGEIPQEAAVGAGVGAATGRLLSGGGALVSKGVNTAVENFTRNKAAREVEDMIKTWERGGRRRYLELRGLSNEDVKNLQRFDPKFKDGLLDEARSFADNFRDPNKPISINPNILRKSKENVEELKLYKQEINDALKMGEKAPVPTKITPSGKRVADFELTEKYLAGSEQMKEKLLENIIREQRVSSQSLPLGIAKGITYGGGLGTLGAVGAPLIGFDPMIGASLGLLGGGYAGAKQAVTQYGVNQLLNKGAQQVLRGQPTLPQVMPLAETAARAGTMMTVPTVTDYYNPPVNPENVSRIEELLRRPKFVVED